MAPTAPSFSASASASSFATSFLSQTGELSTVSLASLSPKVKMARISLMTLILLAAS